MKRAKLGARDMLSIAATSIADRVELCAALPEGGTTPSLGMIERVREVFSGRLMVIIRRMALRAGSDAVIMPGGWLGSGNLAAILQATGASEAHLSARREVASGMTHRNPDVCMGSFTKGIEYQRRVTCADEVPRCAKILRDSRRR